MVGTSHTPAHSVPLILQPHEAAYEKGNWGTKRPRNLFKMLLLRTWVEWDSFCIISSLHLLVGTFPQIPPKDQVPAGGCGGGCVSSRSLLLLGCGCSISSLLLSALVSPFSPQSCPEYLRLCPDSHTTLFQSSLQESLAPPTRVPLCQLPLCQLPLCQLAQWFSTCGSNISDMCVTIHNGSKITVV